MPPNPFARARRLGAALLHLREQRGYTHRELTSKSGVSTAVISRLENPFSDIGQRPNLRLVRDLLDALDVPRGSDLWTELEQYAEDAGRGWYRDRRYADMGQGQRYAAIVEDGAAEVDEYSGLLLPGLLQTEGYARHRALGATNVDAIVAGRLARQQILKTATYRVVLEPQAFERWPVPAEVMLEQLHHLVKLGRRRNVSVHVLRVNAQIGDGITPRAPFTHFTYPDPADPRIVTVDNVSGDMLVTSPAEVAGYADLHERVRGAALSDADSAAFINEVAERLAATT
ncbi:helix-turn-helix transcriptional regulator [Micromonosporaceae bacterium B7E4]